MKDVIIIAIGRELISGRTVDTNSNYLAKNISALGARVSGIHIIDDNITDIVRELKQALLSKPALIITTGGLGPTADDMTLKAVSKALGKRLVKNKDALKMVKSRYHELYRKGLLNTDELIEGRIKMAIIPSGAKPLPNPVGTAPAVFITHDYSVIFCLPGVPAETKAIFNMYILQWVKQHISKGYCVEKSIMASSYDESALVALLDKVSAMYPDVYIKSSPTGFLKEKSPEIFFTSVGGNKAYTEERVENAVNTLKQLMHINE